MQKIELTNKQYKLLLQLVALGIDLIDNAALGDDEEDDDLFSDAAELEGYLMAHFSKFGVKDMVVYDAAEDVLNHTGHFLEEQEMISNSAYINKSAEIASFQLGMRDYKEVNGYHSLDNIDPQEGADKIMSFSMKYLNEIFENGFDNFYLSDDKPAKIISLSSE